QNDVTLKMPAFEWVHVQLHQQKGMISLSPPTICNSALGNTDLTSAAGKLLLSMLAAVAEMERDLLIERTQAGLSRAKAEGKKLGRPPKIASEARREILEKKNSGLSISALARQYGVSRATVAAITD
ncbi:recombinase family protein, partial [Escherichia coli]